jgi:MFS family permease
LGWYAVAAGLARTADEMVSVALVLLVIDRTGSTALAGAAVAAYTLPSVLSGPLLGAWLDRTRDPRLALAGNEVSLAAVAVALVAAIGRAPAPVVLALAAVTGLTLPMTSGGFTSLVPGLVPPERLGAANSVDAAVFNAAAVAGPGIAGAVAATAGPAWALGVVAVAAGLGVVATGLIRVGSARAAEAHPGLWPAVRAGVAHLTRTAPLRSATVATVLGLGSVGMLVVALPLRTEQLGAGRGAAGYVLAAVEVGCVVSVLAAGRWLARWRPERVVLATVTLYGVAVLAWCWAGDLRWLLALAVIAGVANGPTLAALFATRQRYSPPALLAQVSTTGASLKTGAFALGGALGGQLVTALPARVVIALTGLGLLAAAGLGALAGLRARALRPG